MPNNDLKRNSFNLRATQRISRFINLDASVNYTNNKILNPIAQGEITARYSLLLISLPRSADLNYYRNNYIDPVNGGLRNLGDRYTNDPYFLPSTYWTFFENNSNENGK